MGKTPIELLEEQTRLLNEIKEAVEKQDEKPVRLVRFQVPFSDLLALTIKLAFAGFLVYIVLLAIAETLSYMMIR